MPDLIENIIAERSLIFTSTSGEKYDCRPIFGAIYETEQYGFRCPYQILGYGDQKIRFGHGVDSLQALVSAFEVMNVDLQVLSHDGCFTLGGTLSLDLLPRHL